MEDDPTKASSEIPVKEELVSLKEQLKGLFDKIAENRKAEADVSAAIQQESSRSQVVDLEQRLSSTEALIHELTHELSLKKDSEDIDNDLDDIKGDLQSKDNELKCVKLELEDEVRAREMVEADLKLDHEVVVSTLEYDSAYLRKETEYLTSKVQGRQQVVEAGPSSAQAPASSSEILHSQQGSDVSSAMIGFGAAVALVSVIIAIILAKPCYY